MITYEDCLAFTGLTPEAVDHLAVREHLPAIVALGLACHLSTAKGARAHRPGEARGYGLRLPGSRGAEGPLNR